MSVTEFPVPNVPSEGIAAGPDSAIWFTEAAADKIGRISTTGVLIEYDIPTSNSYLRGIAVGPDGALWFTEFFAGKVGRITTAGAVTEFAIPGTPASPYPAPLGIASGPDGALWFADGGGGQSAVGRITTTGSVTEFDLPTRNAAPFGITAGPDGALWFTESAGSGKVGRISTAGAITEYDNPTPSASPIAITPGPDGALWYSESYFDTGSSSYRGEIGRLAPPQTVQVDVRPASLNLISQGVIPVVVFSTPGFDAAAIDLGTVRFAGAPPVSAALEDVNGDGTPDLVLRFRVQDTNLQQLYAELLAGDEDADGVLDSTRQPATVDLTGSTLSGTAFVGTDTVGLFMTGKNLRDFLQQLFGA